MPTHRSQSFFAVTSFFNGKSTRNQGKSEYFAQGKFRSNKDITSVFAPQQPISVPCPGRQALPQAYASR
jgi:hypothetical protein